MEHDTEQDFRAGVEILEPFFEAQDFELTVYPPRADEEGARYFARFAFGNHAVTLEHLRGLASVTYSVGSMSIEHEAYLDALTVRRGAAFPPADGGPDAGYRALLADLESRMMPYFEGPDREFMELAMIHGRRGLPCIPAT